MNSTVTVHGVSLFGDQPAMLEKQRRTPWLEWLKWWSSLFAEEVGHETHYPQRRETFKLTHRTLTFH
jgi:hypothetical protein